MFGFVIESMRSVRVAPTRETYVQEESGWLDLAPFEDLTLWCDVKSIAAQGVDVTIDMLYEMAPTREDRLFRANVTVPLDPTPAVNPVVSPFILDRGLPIARWFRWSLYMAGLPSAPWGATFRLFATATPVGRVAR